MTKKDFELIARALSQAALPNEERSVAAWAIARSLENTYPRFKISRFIEACQPEGLR